MEKSNFDKLVDHFLYTDQLGHYNKDKFHITLYGIKNSKTEINKIHIEIRKITYKYKLSIDNKDNEYTNVQILDIDL